MSRSLGRRLGAQFQCRAFAEGAWAPLFDVAHSRPGARAPNFGAEHSPGGAWALVLDVPQSLEAPGRPSGNLAGRGAWLLADTQWDAAGAEGAAHHQRALGVPRPRP